MLNLKLIRAQIEGLSEDARFEAWLQLYSSSAKEAFEEIERIIQTKDPILKILLAQFLSHVEEKRAIHYLCRLLQDDNSSVFDAASIAFLRNRFDQKLKVLFPLIFSPSKMVQFFAIEQLYQADFREMVPALQNFMRSADHELLLLILTAFRHLTDERVLPSVLPFLKDPRLEVRLRSLFVIGSLYEEGKNSLRKFLVAALKDKEAGIRRSVLWILQRRSNKKDLPIFVEHSRKDPDPNVRLEAVSGLLQFPNKAVTHLFEILGVEQNRSVILKAESVLMGMPEKILRRSIQQILQSESSVKRTKVLLFFAAFQQKTEFFYQFLAEGLEEAKTEKEKLVFIEAFGVYEDSRAAPLLEEYLHSPLLFYPAIASLLKVLRKAPALDFIKYLRDEKLPILAKQTILRHLVQKGKSLDPSFNALLLSFLKNENINLRYLAAQALALTKNWSVEILLEMIFQESDPMVVQLLKESVKKYFSKYPEMCPKLLKRYDENVKAVKLLLEWMQEIQWTNKNLLCFLKVFCEPQFSDFQMRHAVLFENFVSRFVLRDPFFVKEFLDHMGDVERKKQAVFLLLFGLRTKSSQSFVFPLPSLDSWLFEKESGFQESLLELIQWCHDQTTAPLLVSFICNSNFEKYHHQAASVLRSLLE